MISRSDVVEHDILGVGASESVNRAGHVLTDLGLVQSHQPVLMVLLNVVQLLHGLLLLVQGLHVDPLALHLRVELIHCLLGKNIRPL